MATHALRTASVLLLAYVMGAGLHPSVSFAAPPLEVYGNLPAFETAALSDTGNRVALVGSVGDTRRLIVLDQNAKPIINAPLGAMKVRGVFWAGEDTLLVYKSDTRVLSKLEFTAAKAELFSMLVIPINGGKAWSVFANRKDVTGGVKGYHGVRQRDGKYYGYFGGITLDDGLYGRTRLESTDPVLYEVDLQTQDAKRISGRIETEGYRDWFIGPAGTISATLDYFSKLGDWSIRNGNGDKIASGSHPQGSIGLVGLGATPGTIVYSVSYDESSDVDWFELPLTGGEARPVFVDVAVGRAIVDPKTQQIMGYREEADSPAYKFFNARNQKVIEATMRAFPGRSARLMDWNDAFDKLIVTTEGAGDPQAWWSVDIKSGRAQGLGVSYTISAKDVAPVRMIKYNASDGLEIAAVLTLPPGLAEKNLPVVVLPHGGPHARDYPGFDWWAQAFASRGYAVLQPNFRGSDGYGAAFESAGHGEWGRKMQTDISEGLDFLSKEGIVDAKRACIMGASYGGYAALAGVTLQKAIYRCAVSVAGVSDVEKMVSTQIETGGGYAMVRRALHEKVGMGKDLREVSPIRFAAAADAPILLIHGQDDVVVPYDQSANMVKALKKAGKEVEFVTLTGEDHWLSLGATRLAMLKASLAFVEKHNPAR